MIPTGIIDNSRIFVCNPKRGFSSRVSGKKVAISVNAWEKSFSPRLNSSKQRSESSTRCCFWSGVSKRDTYFKNNLRSTKDSCKIVNTVPSDTFKVSATSSNFNLRSPKTILWSFVMFSGTTADFGRRERPVSLMFVRRRLNSAYQSMIVDFPGAETPSGPPSSNVFHCNKVLAT